MSYSLNELTPSKIVTELDKYIIGQKDAKKIIAIAIRNRWRRQQLPDEEKKEISPKNIMLIGPTGVGKTEISKRVSELVNSPFLKVEATKYTEVGYVGRNVESMIRELCEVSINSYKEEEKQKVLSKARKSVEEKILKILLPRLKLEENNSTRGEVKEMLNSGKLDDEEIEIQMESKSNPFFQVLSDTGMEEVSMFDMGSMLGMPSKKITKKMKVKEAMNILVNQESEKLLDKDKIHQEGIRRAEESGIIFIDEIDKVVAKGSKASGPDVSREGVQRDLLPIVEGSTVMTKYGPVRTNYILFIAAGAFSSSKPSDLIPELQGRFPLRAELQRLTREDFIRILREPKNAIVKQYQQLLQVEEVYLDFTDDSIDEMADIAFKLNSTLEDIGARRLATVVEKVLEEISFNAPDIKPTKIKIDAKFVRDKLMSIIDKEDLSKYIL